MASGPRRRLAALLIGAGLALASCGGDGDKQEVQDLLDKAFRADIKSADLKLDATIQAKGSGQFDRPVRIQASGPFRGNEGKLPSIDVDLKIGPAGGGQTVQSGFVTTGDRAFVKFQEVYYERPAAEVRKANESIRRDRGKRPSLSSLGLEPRSWLANADDKGEEKVAGADTRHVSGTLDVAALLNDLNEFVRRSGSAIGSATGQRAPEPLGKDDIEKIEEVVRSPSFDVYVANEDDTIRRVSGRVELEVPERDRKSVNGIQGGSLEFSLELRDVNGDQEIRAPEDARPLSELTRSLGASPPPTPQQGDSTDPESFKRYADCLEKSRANDTEALQRCAELVRP